MEIKDQVKFAQHIFRLLKVTEIVFPIGRTNKGNLGLKFSQNSEDYEIMLDAVPLSTKSMIEDDNNIELKKMIEKYWFDERIISGSQFRGTSLESKGPFTERVVLIEDTDSVSEKDLEIALENVTKEPEPVKKRGRPAGSKNKK